MSHYSHCQRRGQQLLRILQLPFLIRRAVVKLLLACSLSKVPAAIAKASFLTFDELRITAKYFVCYTSLTHTLALIQQQESRIYSVWCFAIVQLHNINQAHILKLHAPQLLRAAIFCYLMVVDLCSYYCFIGVVRKKFVKENDSFCLKKSRKMNSAIETTNLLMFLFCSTAGFLCMVC